MNNIRVDCLLLAALYTDSKTIKELLEKDHDPNISDGLGITPIGWIIATYNTLAPPRKNHKMTPELITCAKLLIEAGAKLDIADIHGRTATDDAKKHDFNEIIESLSNK